MENLELNGRAVKVVRIHTVVHVANLGQLGPVIDTNVTGKLGGATLTKVQDGVLLKAKGTEVLIPHGNIVSIQF